MRHLETLGGGGGGGRGVGLGVGGGGDHSFEGQIVVPLQLAVVDHLEN
jgi:hypothetical protein